MSRPIEAVVAEARQRLESSGSLDVAAFISAYPDHAEELGELLPVMVSIHREQQWHKAAESTEAFGLSLFTQLAGAIASGTAPVPEDPAAALPGTDWVDEPTVADLFAEDRAQAGLSLDEQARRSGLPVEALEHLARNRTPVSHLNDNSTLRQMAVQITAPFSTLVKEVRRLLSLQSLKGMNTAAVFTRDRETSTEAERQALLEKVRQTARKPPEEQ